MFLILPAAVVAQPPKQTDRDFDRIKGKAKTVVVESADFRPVVREWLEQERMLFRSVTYDADGNYTQIKRYDDKGQLRESLVFSYLGKDQVALAEKVNRADELGVVVKTTRRRLDPRYTYKYKYVFGRDGQRLQELMYLNDGWLAHRRVFRRQGRRTVILWYEHDGKLNSRVELITDDNGNEIELVSRDMITDKIVYKYLEFDAQGNWTKRFEIRGYRDLTSAEFAQLKPWSVEYRTITYH